MTSREARLVTSAAFDPAGSASSRVSTLRLLAAIALPLALLALAIGLWWISDQLLYVGPLDRAAFGWIVVVPLWLSAPVAGGFAWQRLGSGQTRLAAAAVTSVVGGATALAFWQWYGTPLDCGFGTVVAPINFVPQVLVVGVVVGGGLALDTLLVRELARAGVRWWAVVFGLGTELVFLGLTLALVVGLFFGHTCFVPGPNYPTQP